MTELSVNGKSYDVDVEPETPLLWVLRDTIGLTGTKYGCGIAQCGACTVHIDGVATRSCQVPVGSVGSRQVTTIEALAQNGRLHPVQKAWIDFDVPQCGYCQSGMIMAVTALLAQKPKPTDADIDAAISNICRCGTYQRIRAAIHAAAECLTAGHCLAHIGDLASSQFAAGAGLRRRCGTSRRRGRGRTGGSPAGARSRRVAQRGQRKVPVTA